MNSQFSILNYIRRNIRFVGICALLLALELICAPLLPSIIPETWYFRHYLSLREIKQTQQFLNREFDIEPDPKRGWRNRPNAVYLTIRHDRFGSRFYNGIIPEQRKKWRIVFLGDSRIHGSADVTNAETISAYLENEAIETLNLGVSGYSLDQIYLSMAEAAEQFRPDMFVIGIGTDMSDFLDCHYLPLVSRHELTLPLLKPRFILQNGQLELQTPAVEALLRDIPDSPSLLEYLRHHDPRYEKFKQFQRWQSTPFLSFFSRLKAKSVQKGNEIFSRLGRIPQQDLKNLNVAKALIEKIGQVAAEQNIELICPLIPSKAETSGNQYKAYDTLASLLKKAGIRIIDVRRLFQQQTNREELFLDSYHGTPASHRLIAEELSKAIEKQ
jgi:lysophospholipase L1-like esterase